MSSYVADLVAVVGLGMVFAGCWWIYPPSALIVVGAVVTAVPIVGQLIERKNPR